MVSPSLSLSDMEEIEQTHSVSISLSLTPSLSTHEFLLGTAKYAFFIPVSKLHLKSKAVMLCDCLATQKVGR